jgi:hypothetical protein
LWWINTQVAQVAAAEANVLAFVVNTSAVETKVHYSVLGKLGVVAAGSVTTTAGRGEVSVAVDPARVSLSASLIVWYTTHYAGSLGPELVASHIALENGGVLTHNVSATFTGTDALNPKP